MGFKCPSGPLSRAMERAAQIQDGLEKARLTPSQRRRATCHSAAASYLSFLPEHQLRASQIHTCFKGHNHTREALGRKWNRDCHEHCPPTSRGGLVPWGASWAGTEPRCHPGTLGPRRASCTLLLSFLPVAWLENGKRGVSGGGHGTFKALAHSPPPRRLHPTASLGLGFQGQQPHWDDPVTSGCPGEGWGHWRLGRPLCVCMLGGAGTENQCPSPPCCTPTTSFSP